MKRRLLTCPECGHVFVHERGAGSAITDNDHGFPLGTVAVWRASVLGDIRGTVVAHTPTRVRLEIDPADRSRFPKRYAYVVPRNLVAIGHPIPTAAPASIAGTPAGMQLQEDPAVVARLRASPNYAPRGHAGGARGCGGGADD